MLKKIFCVILSASIILFGCGTREVDFTENPEVDAKIIEEKESEFKEEVEKEKIFDKDVDIVLGSVLVGDETIEDYIAKLKEENPDKEYSVYDESHYAITIKESERKEMVKAMNDEKYINEKFKELFTEEEYNGAYLSLEYDKNINNFTLYVDKEKFEELGLFNFLTPYIIGNVLSDTIQGYNLVPVEERSFRLLIVDNETKETIYDSEQE